MAEDTIEDRIARIQQHADKMGHDEGHAVTTSEQLHQLYALDPVRGGIMLVLFEATAAMEQESGEMLYV